MKTLSKIPATLFVEFSICTLFAVVMQILAHLLK